MSVNDIRPPESPHEVWRNSMILIASISIMALTMFIFRIIEGIRYTNFNLLLRIFLRLS